ncbi:portal protein [Oryzifoliimicrobium ureilyticus]|uniref:portal protein n=1 Tax=Oryzifoliimicrobium ureilyticus TaxID=3113724 RepID=UPI0030767E9E
MEAGADMTTSVISQLVRDCESYREQLSKDRDRAMEYFDGEMSDVPHQDGRSKVVSRDVRAHVKKVLPSLMRTILGNEKVAEFQPVAAGDEDNAEQATDYISNVVFPESDGYDAVQDAIHDALKLRNGIIRWWYEKKMRVSVSEHSGLDEASLVQLVAGDDVTVLSKARRIERIETPQGPIDMPLYDVKIRRRRQDGRVRLAAVPPEQLLVHPDALKIDESPLTGISMRLRRSELVALGYDRELVEALPVSATDLDRDGEEATRRRAFLEPREMAAPAMQEVDYYELYVRIDADDDGIAELRRMVYAGAIREDCKLEDEEWDEVPFADIIAERRPHQREGTSIADDTMEGQKVKTVLLRETLDNLYWQNKPQPIVQEEAIANPDAVLNPAFGKPIRVNAGVNVREALGFTEVPFVAASSFQMLDYFDRDMADVTGITDAASGLAPDALQNMTAKASAMFEAAGIGQTELMARTIARGLVPVFRGLLKLVIKHQDRPRMVRLRGRWVSFDPRPWNADMDVSVNTGLGAGTRERDMMVMQMVGSIQEKLLSSYGPVNNPFVTPDNVYNALAKLIEASGLKSVDRYFTKPDMAKLAQMQAQGSDQQNPALQKLQAETQARLQKAQMDAQTDLKKLEMERELRLAELRSKAELQRYQIDQEIALRREQNTAELMRDERLSPARFGGQAG